jgi:DASS family divalent anion:Na+ symporter
MTNLGKRISLYIILKLGRGSMLGLGYAIFFSGFSLFGMCFLQRLKKSLCLELILSPFVPSNTARGGGILLPIVSSLSRMVGSEPGSNSVRTGGEYLHLCGIHSNMLMSSMFLTAMAGNPLVQSEAQKILNIEFSPIVWLKGSIVPGLLCAFALPYLLQKLSPSKVNLKELRTDIKNELDILGPMSFNEMKLSVTIISMLVLWVTSEKTKISTELVALAGVFFLLYTDTLKWKNVLENKGAWGTLTLSTFKETCLFLSF